MNGRRLTDAQISKALRAHLPDRAYPGLRERILDAAATTGQRRALPSVIGALGDADPVVRRRGLLIAAALLIALALASVAAVGALRLLQRDPVEQLSLEPRPSLSVVAPSSTPSQPSAVPTASPVTNPAGVWIPTGTMGTPRYEHNAVRLLDGRVLVVGGFGGGDSESTSAELYDPSTGTWSATGDMLRPRDGFPATLLRDGRVLVGDGADRPGAELYDPSSGTWSATGPMVWGGSTATLLRDGRVLVRGDDGSELYDPDRGTWTATASRAAQRHSHAAILLPDGKVLVAGGHAPGDEPTDSAELFDPATESWTPIASMHARRETIVAFLQPDGKVLVMGSSRGDPLSAELYDPATGTWVTAGDTSAGVFGPATLLADGTVLLVGGGSGSDAAEPPFTLAYLYDPRGGTWTTAAPMLRSHGTPPILLLDGTVLVAGGRDCPGDGACVATGSAELYVPAGVSPPPLPAFPSPPPPVFPSPTPRPTPFPAEAGPVPPGARSWKVTVRNESSDPTTLFLAGDGEDGIGPLCGSVTPNVVPPDTTMEVTFLLPPKGVTGCWIWVNPVPGEGGSLFETSDAPLAIEIHIDAGGQVMYG